MQESVWILKINYICEEEEEAESKNSEEKIIKTKATTTSKVLFYRQLTVKLNPIRCAILKRDSIQYICV